MSRLALVACCAVAAAVIGACSDTTDDVVEVAPGQAPTEVSEQRAETATAGAALALGMTRQQLEDASLVREDGVNFGEVETLVINPTGQVTDIIVELNGAADKKVVVPVGDFQSIRRGDHYDLTTTLTVEQLGALPVWTAPVGG